MLLGQLTKTTEIDSNISNSRRTKKIIITIKARKTEEHNNICLRIALKTTCGRNSRKHRKAKDQFFHKKLFTIFIVQNANK